MKNFMISNDNNDQSDYSKIYEYMKNKSSSFLQNPLLYKMI